MKRKIFWLTSIGVGAVCAASFASIGTSERRGDKDRWNMDVVVIDAGHGGKDPGAIGVGGTCEKDVTLAIALKLGKLIEKEMDVDVIYTRKRDEFIELYRRGQLANEQEGKLFISIHCNSTPKKPSTASGFESYILRPGKTDRAIAIAQRENSVIEFEANPKRYQKLTEENFILVAMAQSAYVKLSEHFAALVQEELAKKLGIKNKGVSQAGFLVLVGASMPNILIETGFISNPREERYLAGAKGQETIAQGIFLAVKKYAKDYETAIQ